MLGTHCPIFHPSCIRAEVNALVVVLTSFLLEFVKHGEGSFSCYHLITFQRRVVSWVCSLPKILRYLHEIWYTHRHKYLYHNMSSEYGYCY